MSLRIPNWIKELPAESQESARRRFLLKAAALYFHPDGHLQTLSAALGYAEATLATYNISQDKPITPETAVALEGLLGRDLFPRELFRPDLFMTPEAE